MLTRGNKCLLQGAIRAFRRKTPYIVSEKTRHYGNLHRWISRSIPRPPGPGRGLYVARTALPAQPSGAGAQPAHRSTAGGTAGVRRPVGPGIGPAGRHQSGLQGDGRRGQALAAQRLHQPQPALHAGRRRQRDGGVERPAGGRRHAAGGGVRRRTDDARRRGGSDLCARP